MNEWKPSKLNILVLFNTYYYQTYKTNERYWRFNIGTTYFYELRILKIYRIGRLHKFQNGKWFDRLENSNIIWNPSGRYYIIMKIIIIGLKMQKSFFLQCWMQNKVHLIKMVEIYFRWTWRIDWFLKKKTLEINHYILPAILCMILCCKIWWSYFFIFFSLITAQHFKLAFSVIKPSHRLSVFINEWRKADIIYVS